MAAQVFEFSYLPEDGPPEAEEPAPTHEVFPSPGNPLKVARQVLAEITEDDHMLLRHWRGDWMRYAGPHWVEYEPAALRKALYERLEDVVYEKVDHKTGEVELLPWSPNKGKVDQLLDAMAAPAYLDRAVEAPSWLSSGTSAVGWVPCANGLVNVDTREVMEPTPDYFGTVAIPVEYDPNAPAPVEWLKFLRILWPTKADGTDADEIRLLRQWYGYVLSGRLDLQKLMLLIGPPRCGKGTIARVLTALVGKPNISAPTLAAFSQNFGLTDTIGKTLSIVGDARLGQNGVETAVERILSITGQDSMTVDRKNKTAWTGTFQTRLMILSNELPKFIDASGAIASRCLILKFEQSFLGREDTDLGRRLMKELPGILKWALDGVTDLSAVGRFIEPESHQEEMQALYDLVSPISAFVRDVVDTSDPTQSILFSDLYAAYEEWCDRNRRGAATGTAKFSEALKSRYAGVKTNYRPVVKGVKSPVSYVRGLGTLNAEYAEAVERRKTGYISGSGWNRL